MFGTLFPAYYSYKAVKTKNVKEYVSARSFVRIKLNKRTNTWIRKNNISTNREEIFSVYFIKKTFRKVKNVKEYVSAPLFVRI